MCTRTVGDCRDDSAAAPLGTPRQPCRRHTGTRTSRPPSSLREACVIDHRLLNRPCRARPRSSARLRPARPVLDARVSGAVDDRPRPNVPRPPGGPAHRRVPRVARRACRLRAGRAAGLRHASGPHPGQEGTRATVTAERDRLGPTGDGRRPGWLCGPVDGRERQPRDRPTVLRAGERPAAGHGSHPRRLPVHPRQLLGNVAPASSARVGSTMDRAVASCRCRCFEFTDIRVATTPLGPTGRTL